MVPLTAGLVALGGLAFFGPRLFSVPSLTGLVVLALLALVVYIGVIAAFDRARGGTWRRDLADAISDMRRTPAEAKGPPR